MTTSIEKLNDKHQELLELIENPDANEIIDEVKNFLEQLADAGTEVADPRLRSQLRNIIRFWSSFVYDQTGQFLKVQLLPVAKTDLSLSVSEDVGQKHDQAPDKSKLETTETIKRIGPYEIIDEIGRGGFSIVYKAVDTTRDDVIALKVLRGEKFEQLSRFKDRLLEREQLVATLDHPNIIPVYSVGEYDGQPYIAMKLVESGSLDDRLKNWYWRPSLEDALKIVFQALDGLEYLHQRQIVHRDIKPANLLLTFDDHVYLTDFGIGEIFEAAFKGLIVGTPEYMAPEFILDPQSVDGRVDLYAVGVVLYKLVTGKKLFQDDEMNFDELLYLKVNQALPDLSVLPDPIAQIISHCLAENPDERYQSASDLKAEIQQLMSSQFEREMLVINYEHLSGPIKTFQTAADSIIIGRPSGGWSVDLDLSPDVTVSRRHARLTFENNSYWLEDMSSRSGTWVNNQQITGKIRIGPDDQIRIGQTNLNLASSSPFKYISPPEERENDDQTQQIYVQEKERHFKKGRLTSTVPAKEAVQSQTAPFYELTAALSTAETEEHLVQIVVEYLPRCIPGAQRGALLLLDGRKLTLKAYVPEQSKPSISLHLARLAIEKREAFIWRHPESSDQTTLSQSLIFHGTRSAMYAPLVWQEEVLGIVSVDNFVTKDAFVSDDLNLLMAVANQTATFVKSHILQKGIRQQEIVRSHLLRQFSPQVTEYLEGLLKEHKHPVLEGGRRREPVTILKSGIRAGTALTANLDPKDVMGMLNQLFAICTPIIFRYNGAVERYTSDGIVAVFGSPAPHLEALQWEDALRAGLEMQYAARKLGRQWETLSLPVFQIGIGIHTGSVLEGFIGSDERLQYTVMGDTVDLTTLYCEGADMGEVIISSDVYKHVANLLEVSPKVIKSSHPARETDLEAYLVKGFSTQKV